MDDMSKGFDRKEPTRGSKHKSAKEEVEFDPTSKKVFRVTSTKKKRTTNGGTYQTEEGEEERTATETRVPIPRVTTQRRSDSISAEMGTLAAKNTPW